MNEQQPVSESERAEPRILMVDIETTSLDAVRGSMLDIGAQWLMGGEGYFHRRCRMWPGAEWHPKAEERHGITFAEANDPTLPTESEAVCEFRAWIGADPVILAGLNPSHDRAFTHCGLRRAGQPADVFPHRVVDLHTMAVEYALAKGVPVPPRGFYTDQIYELLGMPPEPHPHRAPAGVQWQLEAMRMLMGIPTLTEAVPYEVVESREKAIITGGTHSICGACRDFAFRCKCSGLERIIAERQRQIAEEGWTDENDDAYGAEELARAAASYALPIWHGDRGSNLPRNWPWPREWWKPSQQGWGLKLFPEQIEARLRELAKAGALMAAEADRLLRMKAALVEPRS